MGVRQQEADKFSLESDWERFFFPVFLRTGLHVGLPCPGISQEGSALGDCVSRDEEITGTGGGIREGSRLKLSVAAQASNKLRELHKRCTREA